MLVAGDLSYAIHSLPKWDEWGRKMQAIAARRPTHVAIGNHDTVHDYNARWVMPYPPGHWNTSRSLFYSYEVGPAHIVVLCSLCGKSGSPFAAGQESFVLDDLASVNHTRTPWTFVIMHNPWYNTNMKHYGDNLPGRAALRDEFEPLFYGRVDAVFAGHVHAYERFRRMYGGRLTVDSTGMAPFHFTIGAGG